MQVAERRIPTHHEKSVRMGVDDRWVAPGEAGSLTGVSNSLPEPGASLRLTTVAAIEQRRRTGLLSRVTRTTALERRPYRGWSNRVAARQWTSRPERYDG